MWVEKRERNQRTLVHHVTKQVGSHTGARSAQHLSKNPRERLENHYYCFTQFLPKDLGTHVPPPWGRAWGKSEFLWTAWPGLGKVRQMETNRQHSKMYGTYQKQS